MNRRTFFYLLIHLTSLALVTLGCSGSNVVPEDNASAVNAVYYNHLKAGKYTELPAAQPQVPATGELYAEGASIFNLVKVNANSVQKKQLNAMPYNFSLYTIPAPANKHVASAITGPSSLGSSSSATLPSLHKKDVTPDSCVGLTDTDLRDCLDNLGVGAAPQSEHVSLHDPQSLAIEVGQSVTDSIADKTVQALTTNVSKADRDVIVAQLTDFTNDDPAHASIDVAAFDPFNPIGYSLSSVVISDNSTSDITGDGVLDPHSTMVTEVVKPVGYSRSPSAGLDSCVTKYGKNINDRYMVKVTTYLHLDYLKAQRQPIPVFIPTDANADPPPEFYDSVEKAKATNHALDANIIKSIYSSPSFLPGLSTEYTLMFQIEPGQITGEYADLLAKMSAAGDTVCQEVVEQHINPRTAIISGTSSAGRALKKGGSSLKAFYQVPTATVSGDSQPVRDYCMVDADGQRVAIVDPVSGGIIPACEKLSRNATDNTRRVMMTKPGACKGDRNHWAYLPARLQTARWGRGLHFILTEWLLHNQVGDYKNIHWWQSVWKSGVQVAIKGGKYAIAVYLKVEFGAIKTGDKLMLEVAKDVLKLSASIVMKLDGMRIAGYKISVPSTVASFLLGSSAAFGGVPGSEDFDYWLLIELSGGAKGFLIDRLTDAAAQMADVSAVGWQDISDRSHYGCLEFSY